MEDSKKIKQPHDVAPKLVFFSLRAVFSLINKKNAKLNPKDFPGSGKVTKIEE
jgi:hypothetical protein